MSSNELVQLIDVKIHFTNAGSLRRRRTIRAVDGVTLSIKRGEILGLVGESGCGKSTLSRALLRLETPTAGTVLFDGVDIFSMNTRTLRGTRHRFQMVFQDPRGSLDPRMTIGATLKEALEAGGKYHSTQRDARVAELLSLVGIEGSAVTRLPHEFSGGQRQRIGIARALAMDPEFIVCDEPISSLDVSIRSQILNLLLRLRAELDLTYLFIAHDLTVVRHISDRVAVMYLGRVVEIGQSDEIYRTPGHPYTHALLSAVPVPDPKLERRRQRIILDGDLPSPESFVSGCRFQSRCWLYKELGEPADCRDEEPELRSIGNARQAACHYAESALEIVHE